MSMFTFLRSGGQTGVDRAALDVALELGIRCGGWCPQGRKAEDGSIPARYPMEETPWSGYPQRTEWNVRDADGTLVLTRGPADRGTALTIEIARRLGKPHLVVDLGDLDSEMMRGQVEAIRLWVHEHHIHELNVAGPRESSQPGIHAQARAFLLCLCKE